MEAEQTETRRVDFDDGRGALDSLMAEVNKLEEAISADARETIEECVRKTEAFLEQYERLLHDIYDEHFGEDEGIADEEETEEETQALADSLEAIYGALEEIDAQREENGGTREFDPTMITRLRELINDMRNELEALEKSAYDGNLDELAASLGRATEKMEEMEKILAAIYSEFIFIEEGEEEEGEEVEVEETVEVTDEGGEEAILDDLVASLDELIGRKLKRAVVANRDSEEFAFALVGGGKVNLRSDWDFTATDGNSILGDPENPDWEAFGHAHLARETDAEEYTKGHYKYPFAKLQDGDLVIFVSALRAIRSYSARFGEDSVFEAAGRIVDLIKETLASEEEEASRSKMVAESRIGKKVSNSRAEQLGEAKSLAQQITKILSGVLADNDSAEPTAVEEAQLDEGLLAERLTELATEMGAASEIHLVESINDLVASFDDSSPEDYAERLLVSS